jgi:hypothetical protein
MRGAECFPARINHENRVPGPGISTIDNIA